MAYRRYSREQYVSSDVLAYSHVKFNPKLHEIKWRNVAQSTLLSLNQDRIDYLLSISGAYSINPLILITIVMMDNDLMKTPSNSQFNQRFRKIVEDMARAHLEDDKDSAYKTLHDLVGQMYQQDGHQFRRFSKIYSKLHTELYVPLITEKESLMLMERDEELTPSLQWPWQAGACWEIGPTHGGAIEGLTKYIPSSLDMGPSLYIGWNQDYEFLGMEGLVSASHAGIIYIHSTCSLEIKAGRFSTYYSHINVSEKMTNDKIVKQGDVIGNIERRPDRANCLCNWDTEKYSCSNGPHLHWEVRRDGLPLSLDNMYVGGMKITAGKYERDASCTDPQHCMFARDDLDHRCATYFTDNKDNIYCPSVRGNTGMNLFDYLIYNISFHFNLECRDMNI